MFLSVCSAEETNEEVYKYYCKFRINVLIIVLKIFVSCVTYELLAKLGIPLERKKTPHIDELFSKKLNLSRSQTNK